MRGGADNAKFQRLMMSSVVMLKERNEVRNTGGTFTSAATIFVQVKLAIFQDFQT
jgi:hypothetical protein